MMKRITIVVPNGLENASSITAISEILDFANDQWQEAGNTSLTDIRIAGCGEELKLRVGKLTVPLTIEEIKQSDLVIIPSIARRYELVQRNTSLISWISEQYQQGAELASICTGSFLLAATGLLDGKRVSTHWDAAPAFTRQFPGITITSDIMTISSERIITNGGGYSFLNLSLFLVEKYFSRQIAILCAKMFQIDIDRISQSPYAIFQAQKNHGDELVSQAQAYIEENLTCRISFEELASQLATSRRNFDRRFIKATGNTPGEYQQRVRMEVAKSAFENGRPTLSAVMELVGYSDEKAFREVFRKITGMSPLDYKAKYSRVIY